MITLAPELAAALEDETAIIGNFLSLGTVTDDGTKYDDARKLAGFRVPERRTINLDGGRQCRALMHDPGGQMHRLFAAFALERTMFSWRIALFREGAWSPGFQRFSGRIANLSWDGETELLEIEALSAFAAHDPRPVLVTGGAQRGRDENDGSLDETGKQLFLRWQG